MVIFLRSGGFNDLGLEKPNWTNITIAAIALLFGLIFWIIL